MAEPALDLSEIVDLYKEDARRMVTEMRGASSHWDEIQQGGKARQELRRLSHQLRGSGRTYGFSGVTRVSKAIEQIVQRIEKNTIAADERTRQSILQKIEKLAGIFGG